MKKIDIINAIREMIGQPTSERIFIRRQELTAAASMLNVDDPESYSSRDLWEKMCGRKPINACTPSFGDIESLFKKMRDGKPNSTEEDVSTEKEVKTSPVLVSNKKTLDILGLVQNLPQEFKDIVSEVNWNITENSITIKLK